MQLVESEDVSSTNSLHDIISELTAILQTLEIEKIQYSLRQKSLLRSIASKNRRIIELETSINRFIDMYHRMQQIDKGYSNTAGILQSDLSAQIGKHVEPVPESICLRLTDTSKKIRYTNSSLQYLVHEDEENVQSPNPNDADHQNVLVCNKLQDQQACKITNYEQTKMSNWMVSNGMLESKIKLKPKRVDINSYFKNLQEMHVLNAGTQQSGVHNHMGTMNPNSMYQQIPSDKTVSIFCQQKKWCQPGFVHCFGSSRRGVSVQPHIRRSDP